MNETILHFMAWTQLSFDEKINLINTLNGIRRNESDKKRTKEKKKKMKPESRKEVTPKIKMSASAKAMFDSLPAFMKKGF